MSGVEDEAEFSALRGEGAQQGDGVGSAGDTDGDAQAGGELGGVDGQGGAHLWMIAPRGLGSG